MNKTVWRPFVLLAFGSALGVILGNLLPNLWLVMGFGICWAIMLVCYAKWRQGLFVILILSGCLLFLLRWLYVEDANRSQLDKWVQAEQVYTVMGEIITAPRVDGDRLMFDLALQQIATPQAGVQLPTEEQIRVTVRLQKQTEVYQAEQLERGSTIRARIRFKKPLSARNPGAFDYRHYLYQQRIHWLGEITHFQQMQVLAKPQFQLLTIIDRLRKRLIQQIEQLYPKPYQGFISSLLLGERDQLDPNIEETYLALGIIHVLSISGLHVSILVGLIFFLLKRLSFTREQAAWLILLLLPVYVLLTGADPPIVRAGLMAGLALMAVICNRWKDVLSFLAIAFVIQLWWNPYWLFTPSFQFTFLITAALIVGVKPLAERLPASWRWIREAGVATLVAQFVSFPIAIRFFYEFTFLSWLANLLFVPLLSCLVLPGSMFAVVISLLQFSWGAALANVTTLILNGIQQGIAWAYPLFFPLRTFQPPSLIWMVLYSMVLIYGWITLVGDLRNRRFHYGLASGLFVSVLMWQLIAPDGWETKTQITFLDVGQGDAILIETDQKQTILIDGGGTPVIDRDPWQQRHNPFEVGKKVVVPYLKYRGINKIDTLILTHGDADHIGGVPAIVERFPVEKVIRNPLPPQSSLEKSLLAQLKQQNVPIYTAPIGVQMKLEPGITWQFLHPSVLSASKSSESTNNDSVVVLFSIYGHRVLMTGDIEQQAEEALLEKWAFPKVDVLKVAHHGSRTSTTVDWLQATAPRHAVISVGKDNRYGHPAPEVMKRLEQQQVKIWRTDTQGAIVFSFYPKQYVVKTMLNSER